MIVMSSVEIRRNMVVISRVERLWVKITVISRVKRLWVNIAVNF